MGRRSNGVRNEEHHQRRNTEYGGKITNIESLSNMKDPQLYKETKKAINRFETEMGVRAKEIKLAKLSPGINGVGSEDGVYLNSRYFKNGTVKSITDAKKSSYKDKVGTETNKPVAHTITHELAHALWRDKDTRPNAVAAGKAINRMYESFFKEKGKKGYGEYAHSNVNEFWAEVVTKAVHGKEDKYTRFAKRIAKVYRLRIG